MKLDYETQYIKHIYLNEQLVSSYDHFPLNLPIMKNLDEIYFHPNVTYIVGENGMGKSTLLEGIAVALGFNPEGGTLNFNFSSYDSHSNLNQYLRIAKGVYRAENPFFFRAESFYNLATHIEELDKEPGGGGRIIDYFGGESLYQQSHGEAFFAAFIEKFRGRGLYILDEPEAALSPLRQLSMLARINELVNQESQFIIATHSPIIMAYPDAKILQLSEEGIVETKLEDTNHYILMKQFFDDRERILHHLFQ
ncbi:AAA family ATPase [Niallia endozanthoxylica]|uniref:AAA family ATPase n=1 Tax=Niallia endozanthoxylica TaxID=2036016 RepID=A0A5J5HNK8_9BACI|nr:AAA family ATPase [Niallia endozanthoxylica]KAA9021573.1 AAA family ATPase [Niallia endozanthoxylica]